MHLFAAEGIRGRVKRNKLIINTHPRSFQSSLSPPNNFSKLFRAYQFVFYIFDIFLSKADINFLVEHNMEARLLTMSWQRSV